MSIIVSRLRDLQEQLAGGGTITYTSFGGAVCTDTGSAQSAYLRAHVPASPGSTIRVKLDAKRVSGDPRIIIDIANQNGTVKTAGFATVLISDNDWSSYECVATMPTRLEKGLAFWANFGVFAGQAGQVEIDNVTIELLDDSVGHPRMSACGLINHASSVLTLNTNYTNHGITALTLDAPNQQIFVEVNDYYSPSGVKFWPVPVVSFAAGDDGLNVIPRAGLYDPATRRYRVYFYNPSTGARVAVPTVNFNLFFTAIGR
jgi:hypothetical protein